jgi:YidC/Oxa1 family membrane protein insertase
MDKRTLLAIAISMGIILVWWKIFPPVTPPPPQPAPATQSAPAVVAGGGPGAALATTSDGAPKAAEEKTTLVGKGARYEFSSWGGSLRHVYLTEPRFLADKTDPASGLEFLGLQRPELAELTLAAAKADFALPGSGDPWTMTQPDPDTVVFRAENDKVAVEKRYHLEGDFRMAMDVSVENKSDAALAGNLVVRLFARQDPEKSGGGMFSGQGDLASVVCFANDKVERATVQALQKEAKNHGGVVSWAAADTKYFAVAVVPHPANGGDRTCNAHAIDGQHGEMQLGLQRRSIAAHGKESFAFTVYAGPKYRETLKLVQPGGIDVSLEKVVDVMFAVLSRPLLVLLKIFQRAVGNWGLAIILLTVFVKIVTFYPAQRAMMSGKKMQRLAPKMAELRKKYENDRQRLGAETMNLYKQNGVSPLGGCLPSLLTMPIWMAMFSTLNYAVELYRVPFLGYIHDLSARDPYFITPLIMGAIMFLQMKMAPAGADPAQQKMMTYMMPVMFTAFSLFLAAGLAIYTLTNSALSILQQVIVNRMDRRAQEQGR